MGTRAQHSTPASTRARGKAEEQLKGRPGIGGLAKATGQASTEQWQLRQQHRLEDD